MIVPFSVIDSAPVAEGVIDTLEEVLARAKNGELSSVAVAYIMRSGAAGRVWSRSLNAPSLIGSIEVMKADIMDSYRNDA